jgi:hypothetical protein
MRARRRALVAVVVAGPLWMVTACTERIPLLTVEMGPDGGPRMVEDASPPRDGRRSEAGSGGRDSGAGVDLGWCDDAPQSVRLSFQSPQVVIAVDRSYSMFTPRAGGRSWWQAVRTELTNYMRANDGAIGFGYEEFPGRATCDRASGCCGSRVLVQPFLNNHWEVERLFRCDNAASGCSMTADHSPSGDALARIREFYSSDREPERDRFILLITDGSPSCAMDPGECDEAGRQAGKLFAMSGVKTIVLPLGDEARASACLDTVAIAGQTRGQLGSQIPWVADPAQVAEPLARAMSLVEAAACRYIVRDAPQGLAHLKVSANWMPLPRDPGHKEGWDFDPPGAPEIQLYGSACARLKNGQMESRSVRAHIPCMQCGSQLVCP